MGPVELKRWEGARWWGSCMPPEGMKMDVQITRNQQRGLQKRLVRSEIYAWERWFEHSEHRVTIVVETGSRKATRQSWEAVQEPPRSACVGRIRGVPWAVLPGGPWRAVERPLCEPQLSIGPLLAPTSERWKRDRQWWREYSSTSVHVELQSDLLGIWARAHRDQEQEREVGLCTET